MKLPVNYTLAGNKHHQNHQVNVKRIHPPTGRSAVQLATCCRDLQNPNKVKRHHVSVRHKIQQMCVSVKPLETTFVVGAI